jgi:hypothetical protein
VLYHQRNLTISYHQRNLTISYHQRNLTISSSLLSSPCHDQYITLVFCKLTFNFQWWQYFSNIAKTDLHISKSFRPKLFGLHSHNLIKISSRNLTISYHQRNLTISSSLLSSPCHDQYHYFLQFTIQPLPRSILFLIVAGAG